MEIIAFIPARLESKRYPNKILKNIFGLPMVEHVRRRALISKKFKAVYIVTNSKKVKKVIKNFGGNVVLSKKKHFNGTSRVSEICKKYNFDYGFILFGDEPFIDPSKISQCIKSVKNQGHIKIFNVITDLEKNDYYSKHIVKAVIKSSYITDYFRLRKNKKYFKGIKKSSGILILKKKVLLKFMSMNVHCQEKNLKIEQFRFLENNFQIKPIYIKKIFPSINTKLEYKNIIKNVIKNKREKKILEKIKNFC